MQRKSPSKRRMAGTPSAISIKAISTPRPLKSPPASAQQQSSKSSSFGRFLYFLMLTGIALGIIFFPSGRFFGSGEFRGRRAGELSTSRFSFVTAFEESRINVTLFMSEMISITEMDESFFSGVRMRKVTFRNSQFSAIQVDFASKFFSSVEFREVILEEMSKGKLSKFKIIAFSEGGEVPRDICPSGYYGLSCQKCQKTCPGELTCDDGAIGTGFCKCPTLLVEEWKSDNEKFGDKAMVPGRCLAVSQKSIQRDMFLSTIDTIPLTIYNIGEEDMELASLELSPVSSSIHDVASFSWSVSNVDFPFKIRPGNEVKIQLEFAPKSPGEKNANLLIMISMPESREGDAEIASVALKISMPPMIRVQGNFTVNRIACGSPMDIEYKGETFLRDEFSTGGQSFRDTKFTNEPLFQTQRQFMVDKRGYRIPLAYKGVKTTVLLYFSELMSNAAGIRLFDVEVEGVLKSNLDVWKEAGGRGKPLIVEFVVEKSLEDKHLSIVFKNIRSRSMVSGIKVMQEVDEVVFANSPPGKFSPDYSVALGMSYLFYETQYSGYFRNRKSRLAWRSDSCQSCIGDDGEDLSGGYYEAGNYMKFTFPYAWVMTQLAWNFIETTKGHSNAAQTEIALDTIRWGVDFLLKCYSKDTKLCLIIGEASLDFGYYGPPEYWEEQNKKTSSSYRRTVGYATTKEGFRSSETVAEVAAALAAASIAFRGRDDSFSNLLLEKARKAFAFATEYQGTFMSGTSPPFLDTADLYPSTDFRDEIGWAAAWLYWATREMNYLKVAREIYEEVCRGPGWAYSWDEKGPGLTTLLYKIDAAERNTYVKQLKAYFDQYLEKKVPHTPKGLGFRTAWGSARYAANNAWLSMIASTYLKDANREAIYANRLFLYGKSQVDYLLGEHGRSYVAGYGNLFPEFVWHKSSYNSILYFPLRNEPKYVAARDFKSISRPQFHIPYGALVGGPIEVDGEPTDWFLDSRANWRYTEVTIDYNAAWTGALALLSEKFPGTPLKDEELDLGQAYLK